LHGQNDIDEVVELRDKCLSDPKVLEQLKKFKISEHLEVVCDTWPYGRDSEDNLPRYIQVSIFPIRSLSISDLLSVTSLLAHHTRVLIIMITHFQSLPSWT
jgi:hypothetical protein